MDSLLELTLLEQVGWSPEVPVCYDSACCDGQRVVLGGELVQVRAATGSLRQRQGSKCISVSKPLFGQVKGLCEGLEAPVCCSVVVVVVVVVLLLLGTYLPREAL